MPIQDLPERERPRERLLQRGAQQLSNTELLAILLATSGQKGVNVLDLAQRVLTSLGDLHKLVHMSSSELRAIKGIGQAKAVLLMAVVELSRRLTLEGTAPTVIKSPRDVEYFLAERFRYEAKERFFALQLNTKNVVLGLEEVSVGSLNASIVHPREVFRPAIRQSAASIIVAHNHPSGDPTPSPEDIEVTRRLTEAGKILGIVVLDHIIFGNGVILSLKDKGLM
ncbi:MAG: DNA repair protein RadC [Peptococcaceae bacterium]|nr:DNA repair protein RadC [Peptococcaceae bacterium]